MPTWNPTSGNNYSLGANWGGTAPTTTTDAIFDGSVSNADCIVNGSVLSCLKFRVINGYTGTITFNFDLNVYSNYEVDAASATSWTFSAASNIGLLFRVSATIDIPTTRVDSNIGMFILTSGVGVTLTLARDTTIANFTRTWNNPNTNVSFTINRTSPGNGDNLYVTGNFTHTVLGTFGGTTTVNFTTSTTSTLSITSAGLASDVVFNGTGTFTGTFAPGAGNTTTYTSGDTTGLNLFLVRSATIISNGTTWNNVDFRPVNSQTLTIDTDLIYGGVLSAFTSFRWDISHVSGSVIRCRGTGFNTANLRNADVIIETALPCTVSLSNQNDNMDLTFNPFPGGQITWVGGLFIGTSTLTYLTSNGGPVPLVTGAITLNPNSITTFDTSPGSSNYIVFGNLTSTSNATMTLVSDLHFSGNLSKSNSNVTVNTSTGSKLILGGSTNSDSGNLLGSAIVQLGYTGTWNNAITIQNDLLISPLSGQTVTIQSIRKGLTTKSITYTSGGGTLNSTASNLLTIGTITVPMLTSGMTWNNITISVGSTLQLDEQLNVSGTLTCSGNATFTGSFGFTTNIFSAQTAASVLTFQNINANPLAEYRINGNLTIIGTALSRITLQSAGSAAFTGTANGTTLTRASGTVPSIGMAISQATGTAPAGLLALFPTRPVINGGTDPNFTLDLNVTPSTGSIAMRAGYKAVFILENNGVAAQSVAYTTCQDIDSSGGQTILSFQSNNDDQTTNVSLFRTLNWRSIDPITTKNYSSVYVY
jgi:hypothetical protein